MRFLEWFMEGCFIPLTPVEYLTLCLVCTVCGFVAGMLATERSKS